MKTLTSAVYDVDDFESANELFHGKGWTDGLPIVPPTRDRVTRFIEAAGREPDEILGVYTTRRRVVTVEKVAINAVMAGCLPEYLPVVVAIVESILEEVPAIHPANSSTGGPTFGFIVNGPVRNKLSMNYRGNVLGPGNRANSTIGRAVRLAQINIFGTVGGAGFDERSPRPVLDRATLGQPGKYACYHIVENEEDFPSLAPLHVERGYAREQSAVTVFATDGHTQISVHSEHSAQEIADTIAQYLVGSGKLTKTGWCIVIIPPENAKYLVRDGWSKAALRKALFERTTRSMAWVKQNGWAAGSRLSARGGPVLPGDEKQMYAIARSADDIYVVVAGGPAGGFVDFLLPYSGHPLTKLIRM